MRIAHVVATFPPYWAGTGNVAYQQSRVLHERGYAVEVFTALPAHEQPMDFPFPVHYLKTWGRLGNAPFTPSLIRQLRGFDLIHLHYPYIFGADLTVIAARRYHIPVVATYHNDLLGSGFKGMLFSLYNSLRQPSILRKTVRVITTTRDYANHSKLATLHPLPIGVIPLAVDLPDATVTEHDINLPIPKRFVLFVGALDSAHRFKGLEILLDAMVLLKDTGIALLIAGDGNLRSEFVKKAQDLYLSSVTFVGKVPPSSTLRALYKQAIATVLPSISTESFGLVILESWANQTPVVATLIPGVRELIGDGSDGLLVSPGDPRELAKAITQMAENPRKAQRMGEAGYQKVRTYYTWDRVVDQIEALYREVVQTA